MKIVTHSLNSMPSPKPEQTLHLGLQQLVGGAELVVLDPDTLERAWAGTILTINSDGTLSLQASMSSEFGLQLDATGRIVLS